MSTKENLLLFWSLVWLIVVSIAIWKTVKKMNQSTPKKDTPRDEFDSFFK